jgi:hypothetical protein
LEVGQRVGVVSKKFQYWADQKRRGISTRANNVQVCLTVAFFDFFVPLSLSFGNRTVLLVAEATFLYKV